VDASRLAAAPSASADFTIAIIPDPQYLAEDCPDRSGLYYTAMMRWIVANKNIVLTASASPFHANIKAVVGVGDCVNARPMINPRTPKPPGQFLTPIASPSLRLRAITITPAGSPPANARQIDAACGCSVSQSNGAGQTASVFLLSRRLALGLLEGRMISTRSGPMVWSEVPSFPAGTNWSASEKLLFSVPFRGLPAHVK
jgi:hypothetical protein